ncbi:MAG: hypothetical protein RSC90_11450 [Clostridia bacterium]
MKKCLIFCLMALMLMSAIAPGALAFEEVGGNEEGETALLDEYAARILIDGKYYAAKDEPVARGMDVDIPLADVLAGCGMKAPEGAPRYVSEAYFEQVEGVDVGWDAITKTVIVTSAHPADNLYLYNLGDSQLKPPSGAPIAYQPKGILGVPAGEKRPVVVILHGAHTIIDEEKNRYDLGFSGLVDALADNGYLALSMDIALSYSFNQGEPVGAERTIEIVREQLAKLKVASEGGENPFPCDLTGKADLDNVLLIGHSRAGLDILEVAEKTPIAGLKGMIMVAPAEHMTTASPIPDVPLGVLIPQYDADVVTLDGANLYETAISRADRTAPAELIYLHDANHAGFTSALLRQDNSAPETATLVAPQVQQAFLSDYAVAFARAAFAGKTPLSDVARVPETLFGMAVVPAVFTKPQLALITADAKGSASGAQATRVVHSSLAPQNTAGTFNPPGSFEKLPLLRLEWDARGGSYTVPVSADLSKAAFLSLRVAPDSADPRNAEPFQRLSITLRDAAGATACYTIPDGESALARQNGEVQQYEDWDGSPISYYSTYMPIGTCRVPIAAFQVIDLAHVASVSLSFDQTHAGCLMLRDLSATA